ncbi:MAG: prepilin-type N-terminal cleavage/methylation domain-containing protein [Proteobacteria bacterium]|nr:prepilin-type N-terminal cleavage/methylation domain-containing protein [Pseudomonadota bacterium]
MKPGAKGFTLIELAIVMVIMGILVSIGAGMIGPLTIRMKTTETKENVNAALEGIIGYAATNNRLPTLAQFPNIVRTQKDAWNNTIQYIFDNNLATSICDRTTTNITLRVCNDAACTTSNTVNNVAYIILSGGSNFNNQTAANQAVAAATMINTYLTGIAVDNYAGDFTRATDEYDDIIKWVTLPELQTKLSCGRCSAYEIWNNLGVGGYFRINGIGCGLIPNNTLISSIGPGGNISGFTDASCTAPAAITSITYTQATATDANRNCAVNYNNTDR